MLAKRDQVSSASSNSYKNGADEEGDGDEDEDGHDKDEQADASSCAEAVRRCSSSPPPKPPHSQQRDESEILSAARLQSDQFVEIDLAERQAPLAPPPPQSSGKDEQNESVQQSAQLARSQSEMFTPIASSSSSFTYCGRLAAQQRQVSTNNASMMGPVCYAANHTSCQPMQPAATTLKERGFAECRETKLAFASKRMRDYFDGAFKQKQRNLIDDSSAYQFFKAARSELIACALMSLLVAQSRITCRTASSSFSWSPLMSSNDNNNNNDSSSSTNEHSASCHLVSGLVAALAVAVLTQIFGHLSGAHLLPAVSWALHLKGRISRARLLAYLASQALGALLGIGLLAALTASQLEVQLQASDGSSGGGGGGISVQMDAIQAHLRATESKDAARRQATRTSQLLVSRKRRDAANEEFQAAPANSFAEQAAGEQSNLAIGKPTTTTTTPTTTTMTITTTMAPSTVDGAIAETDSDTAARNRESSETILLSIMEQQHEQRRQQRERERERQQQGQRAPKLEQQNNPSSEAPGPPGARAAPSLPGGPRGFARATSSGNHEKTISESTPPPPARQQLLLELVPLGAPAQISFGSHEHRAALESAPALPKQRSSHDQMVDRRDEHSPPTVLPKLKRKRRTRQWDSTSSTTTTSSSTTTTGAPLSVSSRLHNSETRTVNLLGYALPEPIMSSDSASQCLARGNQSRKTAAHCLARSNASQMFILQLLATLLIVLAYLVGISSANGDQVDTKRIGWPASLSVALAHFLAHQLASNSGGFYGQPAHLLALYCFSAGATIGTTAPQLSVQAPADWPAEWLLFALVPLLGGLLGALSHEYIETSSASSASSLAVQRRQRRRNERALYSLDELGAGSLTTSRRDTLAAAAAHDEPANRGTEAHHHLGAQGGAKRAIIGGGGQQRSSISTMAEAEAAAAARLASPSPSSASNLNSAGSSVFTLQVIANSSTSLDEARRSNPKGRRRRHAESQETNSSNSSPSFAPTATKRQRQAQQEREQQQQQQQHFVASSDANFLIGQPDSIAGLGALPAARPRSLASRAAQTAGDQFCTSHFM